MSKSTARGRPGRATRRSGRRGRGMTSVEVLTRPQASLPALVALSLWRWRWELAILAAVLYVYDWAAGLHLSTAELVLLAEVPLIVAVVPVTRRFVRNRFWCVITRHRVRTALAEVRAMNHSGNLPFLVTARSTKVGESLWLLLRPGLSVEDLANRAETVASACWAREARIVRSRNIAALVRVEVIRRDPLGRESITSPLMRTPRRKTFGTGPIPAQPPVGTAPATGFRSEPGGTDTQGTAPAFKSRLRKRTDAPSPSTTTSGAPAVLGLNGEDITDYV